MKVKIELTEEQISKLLYAETKALEAVKTEAIKDAEKVFNDAVKALKNKYKYQEIEIDNVSVTVVPVDEYKKLTIQLNNKISNARKKNDAELITKLLEEREQLKASKK